MRWQRGDGVEGMGSASHIRTLVIHPMLAPYRVDLFNAVSERLELEVVFQRKELSYHRALDQGALRAALHCRFGYLEGNRVIMRRDFPAGIPRLLRERTPEVVVTTEFSLPTYITSRCRGYGAPRFGHIIWSDENLQTLREHNLLRRALRWLCTRRIDAMLMCYDGVAEAFARRFKIDQSIIHRVGVHQAPATLRARFDEAAGAAESLVVKHALSGRRVLLFVGRLAAEKNLERGLRSFAAAADAHTDLVFVLVGSGEQRFALEALAQSLGIGGRVIFTGHCEGAYLYAWYRIASAFFLPSIHEPYGAVINEALVCGVPVICSERAGAAHLVRTDEIGLVFDPKSQNDMDDAVCRMAARMQPAEKWMHLSRRDLMPVPFSADVDQFVSAVELAAASVRTRTRA